MPERVSAYGGKTFSYSFTRWLGHSLDSSSSSANWLADVLNMFHSSLMPRKRFAIITYDPDRVGKLSWQGEGHSLAWIVWRGLCGWTYPKERGIINMTLMDQLPSKPHPSEDLLK